MRPPDPAAAPHRRSPAAGAHFLLALVLLAAGAVPLKAQSASTEPARAVGMAAPHPPPAPGGVPETSLEVMKVTTRVLCMCGGCVNQTLHECTCGMAAEEREKVAGKISAGEKPDDIIKAYVDEFGPQILSTPEKKGFNLVGWLVPFAVAIILLASLTVVLRGWVRPEKVGSIPSIAASAPGDDPTENRYRERLEKELKEHEG